MSWEIGPARPDEWEAAVTLSLRAKADPERVRHALGQIERGAFDPGGVFVARRYGQVAGTAFVALEEGGAAQLWALEWRDAPGPGPERELIDAACAWLESRGRRYVMVATPSVVDRLRGRFGFAPIGPVLTLAADPHTLPESPEQPDLRIVQRTRANDVPWLAGHIDETLVGSLDVPELSSVQTGADVVASFWRYGRRHAALVAFDGDRPVGHLLLAESKSSPNASIRHLGVVPERRRRGVGRRLLAQAGAVARAAEAESIEVRVDVRNDAALQLYRAFGFATRESEPFLLRLLG